MKAAMLAVSALLAPAALAAGAEAQTPAPAAAPVKICTTTTTVVRRGDVVVSNTSTTRCEDEAPQGGAPGASAARAVFSAPGAAVKSVLGSGLLAGGGDDASASNVRGDWRVAEVKSGGVCHIALTSQPAAAGFRVRNTGCPPPMSRAQAWTFDNGDVLLHSAGGDLVLRLTGNRDHLAGATDAGDRFELMR